MIEQLLVRLVGNGESFERMLKMARVQAKLFERNVRGISKKLGKFGSSATQLGQSVTLAMLPATAAVGGSVKAFADFDQALTESISIMDVTEKQTRAMKDAVLELSGEVIQTPRELARSYFYLASAGLDAERSMAALPVVAQFATAGAFDMATATDLLTDAQTAMGMAGDTAAESLSNLSHIADVFVAANQAANTSVQQVSEAMTADAGTAARQMGQSLESTVAVLQAYADAGKKGAEAGNLYGRATRLLTAANIKHGEEFKRLGIRVVGADGQFRDFIDVIKDMEKAFEGMTKPEIAASLQTLGFKALAQKSITPLIGVADRMAELRDKTLEAGEASKKVATTQLTSFSNQLKITRNRLIILAIKIGDALEPALRLLNKALRAVVGWFNNMSDRMRTVIAVVLLVAAVIGPLILIIGQLASALSVLIPIIASVAGAVLAFVNPVVLAIAAVGALILVARGLLGSWADVGRVFQSVGRFIVNSVILLVKIQKRVWTVFFGWLLAKIWNVFTKELPNLVLKGLEKVGEIINKFREFAIAKIQGIFTGEDVSIQDFFGELGGDFLKGVREPDLLKSIGSVIGESFSDAEFGPIIPPDISQRIGERIEPIKATITESKDNASKAMENVATDTQQMVELLQQQVEKEGLTLEAAGLQK